MLNNISDTDILKDQIIKILEKVLPTKFPLITTYNLHGPLENNKLQLESNGI